MGKFLIGLVFGVIIAIGVVYYLNTNQAKIISKMSGSAVTEESSTNQDLRVLAPGTKIKEVASDTQSTDYDFYQILQNKNAASGTTTGNNKPSQVFIQVGVFTDANAAKDMKGRVAFLGYDANVVSSNESDGMRNRVVLGPFNSESEAAGVKRDLEVNGIKSVMVK